MSGLLLREVCSASVLGRWFEFVGCSRAIVPAERSLPVPPLGLAVFGVGKSSIGVRIQGNSPRQRPKYLAMGTSTPIEQILRTVDRRLSFQTNGTA
jgi:hypothetical protein